MTTRRFVQLTTGEYVWHCGHDDCATLECCDCGHKWNDAPRGPGTSCPKCGHIYTRWLNYQEWACEHEEPKT
jgi:hypothetical protein